MKGYERYGNKISESPESIRKRAQTAKNIQSQISIPKTTEIICSADIRIGRFIRFFKRSRVNYQLDGQASLRCVISKRL